MRVLKLLLILLFFSLGAQATTPTPTSTLTPGFSTSRTGHYEEKNGGGHDFLPVLCIDANNQAVPCVAPGGGAQMATGLQNFQLNANTACAGVIGTSAQYLTITAKSAVFISNLSTGSIFWLLTSSLTPPTNTNVLRHELPSGQQLCLSASLGDLVSGYNYLHYINANAVSSTGSNTWN